MRLLLPFACGAALLAGAPLARAEGATPSPPEPRPDTTQPPADPNQAGPIAPPVELVPPHRLSAQDPPYPTDPSCTEDAQVVVEIVVGADGHVEDAHAIRGEAPFAESAVEATRSWVFSPATRNGTPVRARVRAAVDFKAPPKPAQKAVEPELPPPPPVKGKPAPGAVPPDDTVQVLGRRYETQTPTERRLGSAEVRMLPGAFGDAFRAIEILPGVVPAVSGFPYYFIRGAPPSSVGYVVDDMRVPYLFHFGLGPSVIQPSLIDEVALHPAAYPARYGRFAGGMVAGDTKAPTLRSPSAAPLTGEDAPHAGGEALLRIFDVGGIVHAPIDGGRGEIAVGGRYAYPGLLLRIFAPHTKVDYRDYNARFTYQLTDTWRLTAFALGAYDYVADTSEATPKVLFASEFHRLDVRLDKSEAKRSTRIAATVGIDRSLVDSDQFAQDVILGARARHREVLGKGFEAEVGSDLQMDLFGGNKGNRFSKRRTDYEETATLLASRTEFGLSGWGTVSYRGPRMALTGTLRGDVFTSAGKKYAAPSPRLSGRVPLTKETALLFAFSTAAQPPAFAIPVPAIGYTGIPGGLATGYHESVGVEVALPWKIKASGTVYHHAMRNLGTFFAIARAPSGSSNDGGSENLIKKTDTQSYGLELFAQRKFAERFSILASYTLSRTTFLDTALPKQVWSLSPFDRTHVIQLASSVDVGKNWLFGGRFVAYSGWPKQGSQDHARLPAFFRIDARIEKRWIWGKSRRLSFIIEALNATGSKEILSQDCSPDGTCQNSSIGPITLPSLGLEGTL